MMIRVCFKNKAKKTLATSSTRNNIVKQPPSLLAATTTTIRNFFSTKYNNNINNSSDKCNSNVKLKDRNNFLDALPSNYDPAYSNTKTRYRTWETSGYFNPDSVASNKLSSSFSSSDDGSKYFSMVLPPPNVTGKLHIGHALTVLIQDSLARWQRMKGKKVLWIPGLDHAGIATQVVVEKQLMREQGLTRHNLGREKFLEQVWAWYEEYGDEIYKQLKELGASLDWSRSAFTMDNQRSKAVTEAFVQLYERDLIFRGRRIVNWCPILNTAISDIEIDLEELHGRTTIEVPYIEKTTPKNLGIDSKPENENVVINTKQKSIPVEFGIMYNIEYPLSSNNNNSSNKIIISTTRPETIPADVAIAVHSKDPRYKFLFEENAPNVLHPITGEVLTVVKDDILVDPELGSGVVKITPSHDLNDYECAMRHNLSGMNIMDDDGYLNENAKNCNLNGLNRYHARIKILDMLKEKGLFIGEDEHPMTLTRCSRSGDVLEPLLKPQWFVNCDDLAKKSMDMCAIDNGYNKINIRPSRQLNEWNRWLENIQDWCISRQLWWGHRIPAYKIVLKNYRNTNDLKEDNDVTTNDDGLENWIIARSKEDAEKNVIEKYNINKNDFDLIQDEDVLDTWFSSALFPLSALGWPCDEEHNGGNNNSYKHAIGPMLPASTASYYPLSLMETGVDILFFWVARMSMICTELTSPPSIQKGCNMKESAVIPPFEKVFLHPLVRDKEGKKMSKSLGNVIDPLHIINGVSLKELVKNLKSSNLDTIEIKRAEKILKKDFPNGIDALGVDSLRYALASYLKQGRQINIDIQRVVTARQFCNKIWHASKYVISNISVRDNKVNSNGKDFLLNASNLENQWILNRLHKTIEIYEEGFSSYNFAMTTDALRTFFINDFCDVYLELTKKYLNNQQEDVDEQIKQETQEVLIYVLDASLKMLHPIIPFITEDLYEVLHRRRLDDGSSDHGRSQTNSIMMSSFPTTKKIESFRSDEVENRMDIVLKSVHGLRSLRNTMLSLGVQANALTFSLITSAQKDEILSQKQINIIKFLSRLPDLNISECRNDINIDDNNNDNSLKYAINDHINLNVSIDMSTGPVKENLTKEISLLTKREKKFNKQISNFHNRLSLQDYKDKVPLHVQEKDLKKLNALKIKLVDVQNSLETLQKLINA